MYGTSIQSMNGFRQANNCDIHSEREKESERESNRMKERNTDNERECVFEPMEGTFLRYIYQREAKSWMK